MGAIYFYRVRISDSFEGWSSESGLMKADTSEDAWREINKIYADKEKIEIRVFKKVELSG